MKATFSKRVLSALLCIALVLSYLPITASAAAASSDHISRISDPSTMDSWKEFFFPGGVISTENAGGVWVDKSVFTNDDAFRANGITMDHSDAFLVALSVMASNMTVTGMSHVPTDTMLILDVSASMGPGQNNVAAELVEAANTSIASLLLTNPHSRVGVVLYSGPTTVGGAATTTDAVLILPLGRYTTEDDVYLNFSNNRVSLNRNVVYEGTNNKPTTSSKAVTGGTYMQKGVMLASAQLTADDLETTVNDSVLGTIQRKPVMVLMSDGAPTFSSTSFRNPTSINLGDGTATSAAQGFVNQLTAAYAKKLVEEKYGTTGLFYTIGLGVSDDAVAVSVLDPDNANASVAINDFWKQWENAAAGGSVTVQAGSRGSSAKTVTKIDGLVQNYVDDYINVENDQSNITLGDRLKAAFADIVGKINLQSKYTPTLILQTGENHSGFISFVDKIGEYMQVTDVKGILINDTLYSGADLASNFVPGGGNLGTFENPTQLGHEMVAAVRERIGLASDDEARTLIALAYEYGQIRYSSPTDYSNFIGWYADKNSKFLGFYQEGVTNITDPEAVYTIRSYGYLGVAHDSNMMYATVQLRHNIQTGEETVAFAVPAALIPVMTYHVSLDSDGSLTDIEVTGAQSPIRLVYEVSLDSHINEWNVKEIVSADYLADVHNGNADGTVNFYTNAWEHTNSTGYNTVNTYSYFNPSRQNDKYYYTANAPVYADDQGTLYVSASAPDAGGTFYRAHTVYEENGAVRTKKTVYRQLSSAALETAKQAAGTNTWYIPNGNVHVNLDGYTVTKDTNRTETISVANQPFVDVYGHNVSEENHTFYIGATLGNNGKLTLRPQTGLKISKTLAQGAAATDEAFTFILNKENPAPSTHDAWLVSADGTEAVTTVVFDNNGMATVNIKAGQTLYIGDMTPGEVVSISETETVAYKPAVTVSGVASANPAEVAAAGGQLIDVQFVNADRGKGNLTVAKRVEHDFGVDYQIPAQKRFTMQVSLSGVGTANATFAAAHTNGAYTTVTTDANGQFAVEIAHGEKFEIFGLPAGTVATVVETEYGTGFTPAYWDDGVLGDGQVAVIKDATVSVVVVNDYQAEEVYPVNLELGGEKIVKNAEDEVVNNWDAGWEFTVVLERHGANGWEEIDRKTLTAQNKSFAFDMSNEVYDAPGVYSYQLYEVEPEMNAADRVDGMIYDRVRHAFSVYVSDADMDGRLEIVKVHSEHANKDFELIGGKYTIKADFENIQTVTVPAQATINVQKILTNESESPLVSLAGYNFGLYTDAACTVPAAAGNGIQAIGLNPTDGVGEGWIEIRFAQSGQYTFYLKEIAGGINNMAYSPKVVQVVVNVSIHPQNANALVADVAYYNTDGSAYTLNSQGEVEFTNVYSPTGAALNVDFVFKKLVGRAFIGRDNFTFRMAEINTPAGRIPHKTLTGSASADSDGDGVAAVVFSEELRFGKVGTYVFQVLETSPDGNGITTDKTVYLVVVTVADHNGKLEAGYSIVNVVGDTVVFENSYQAKSVAYAISGKKNLTGRVLLNDEFTFTLTEALNAHGDIASGARSYETHNEFGGMFTFPEITYTEAGTYYYVVSEKQNGGSAYGIKYDNTKYVVTVTVTDDTENGKLVATANLGADAIVFNNRYVANPVSKGIDGEKVLIGKTLESGQFSFELWQSNAEWEYVGSQAIQTVSNDSQGNFAFSFVDYTANNAREFTKVGSYYYLMKEVDGGQTIHGITYDSVVYRVRVDITDDLLGQLHATVHNYDDAGIPQQSVVFRNIYEITADADLIISGTKKLNNQIPENRTFEFELYQADADYNINGSYIQKVTQNRDGSFRFTINYKPEDISAVPYYYVVKETNAGQRINGVTYDETQYCIAVKVEDNGIGGVKTTAVIRKGEEVVTSLDFANTYKADPVSIVLEGTKVLENRSLAENEFQFFLYAADQTYVISAEATPKEAKNRADGSFTFDAVTFDKVGTYYFVIVEDANTTAQRVTNDTAVYHLAIEIKDDGNGNLYEASRTLKKVGKNEAVEEIVFRNIFTPKPADITVEIGVVKTVVNKGSDKIGPEGFEFLLENTQTGEKFSVKTDVFGSAAFTLGYTESDIGKTYTYLLTEVNGGKKNVTYSAVSYTITVTVSLNENNILVATLTKNGENATKVVEEFENVYDYTPPQRDPENPKTGDNTHIHAWLAFLLISCGGLLTTTLYATKKKEEIS